MGKRIRSSRNIQKVILDGQSVYYRLKVSSRAKRVRFEISQDNGLTVIVPGLLPLESLPAMLQRKARWIRQKLDYFASLASELPPTHTLRDGAEVLYQGKSLILNICDKPGNRVQVKQQQNVLRIVTAASSNMNIDGILERWYRVEARRVVSDRVRFFAREFEVSYGRVAIRNQKTRWGSCSQRGNLNFNWRLVMMPPEVLDYIVIHELTHLNEPNHSRRFWQLVEERCNRYKEHKKWLKKNGAALLRHLS